LAVVIALQRGALPHLADELTGATALCTAAAQAVFSHRPNTRLAREILWPHFSGNKPNHN